MELFLRFLNFNLWKILYRIWQIQEHGVQTIVPEENCPLDNCPQEKLPPGQLLRRKIALQIIIPSENGPPPASEDCPLTIKFLSKIIAPTQANSRQRVLRVNWRKLSIVYEYYDIWVPLLRGKKWFTSIYFLQILTKPSFRQKKDVFVLQNKTRGDIFQVKGLSKQFC